MLISLIISLAQPKLELLAFREHHYYSSRRHYHRHHRYHSFSGLASFYGDREDGSLMANGHRFHRWGSTCAHRRLPFGTRIRVTNTANGKSTICTVTDRGPFVRGREVDLSEGSFRKIGNRRNGVIRIRTEVLSR